MKIGILVGIGVLGCGAAWAADNVRPLNIKLGQWESRITTTKTGPPPMSPAAPEKLTPEQRTKAEQVVKSMMAPQTRTAKNCLTRADLHNSFGGFAENASCQRTVVSSTPSQQEFKIECTNKGILTTGTVHFDAIDPEHVSGRINMTMDHNGEHRTMNMTILGRWLGEACPVVR
ncbi:MAG: DUF3617 domain-containing protein [Bryobacteraceae bacterium]